MNEIGVLREIADNELELMRIWRNQPAVRANMYTQHEIGRDEHMTWWRGTRQRADKKYFMYEFEGVPTGIAAFTDIDLENRIAAWAFYAAPGARYGTGSKMEFLMLEYAFISLSLRKLYCEVLDFNVNVIKLHYKFGFIEEGVFRGQQKVGDLFIDIHRLGIFAEEWQKRRGAILEKIKGKLEK